MAYIGKKVEETELANRTVDTMTGDGSDTTMSLSATPISVNNVLVFFNGVMQRPTTDFTLSGSTITFAAAPFTGAVVVAITGEGGHIGRPSSPLPTEKFMNSAVTNDKISTVAASKLTGAMPALDGTALTGGPNSYTESTSDPAINTNPSTGVGTFWVNKSSGEVFCCTDATAGENVWTNVGSGSGDVQPWYFPGTISGYTAGGLNPTSKLDKIDKFSFSSDSNAVAYSGDLTVARYSPTGYTSNTHGYVSGGSKIASPLVVDTIDKFSFTTEGNATDVGNLTTANEDATGNSSNTHGYNCGGYSGGNSDKIEKNSFATDGNSTDIGNLTVARFSPCGCPSTTHGYMGGGKGVGIPQQNVIDKFSFSTDGNATDVGDMTSTVQLSYGTSSTTHGYSSGGLVGSQSNVIQKFSFSVDSNATDIGDLTIAVYGPAGQTSTTHGYSSGGHISSNNISNVIEKFPFASDANATDVGDLVVNRHYAAGTQY